MTSDDLEQLLRWESSGGTWQVLARSPGVVEVALLTCAGDEEMGRLRSRELDLAAYVGEARPSVGVVTVVPSRRPEDADPMTDRDDFVTWVKTALYEAELALHNGDAAPRRALWSRAEPVSVLGAWRSATGQRELDELFAALAEGFSDCTSYAFELRSYDVMGDMAYTAGFEHTSASVNGQPRTYTLRATQVYRREDGAWRVAHRHADTVTE